MLPKIVNNIEECQFVTNLCLLVILYKLIPQKGEESKYTKGTKKATTETIKKQSKTGIEKRQQSNTLPSGDRFLFVTFFLIVT